MKILLATTSSCGNLQTAGEVIWIMEQFGRINFFDIWLPMETLFSKQMIVSLYSLAIPTPPLCQEPTLRAALNHCATLVCNKPFLWKPMGIEWESMHLFQLHENLVVSPPVSPKIAGGSRSRRLAKGHLPFSTLFELDGCFTVKKKCTNWLHSRWSFRKL